ncbi:extensin family protein [Nannocystis sp.]|uniref:extensin family protein n=1 Tax=Nannocystis sp. TaxID=1962667 RepID=UPI0025E5F267|nr:extensin family protein [Nannocystis sp.]
MTTLLLALVVAGSPGKPRKVRNMPDGWTWPPSAAMKEAGARCLAALDAAEVQHRPAAPVKKIATPIEIPEMRIGGITLVPLRGEGPFPMDCHFAAAIAGVAPELRALGVRSLHFRTLHKYRAVRKRGKSMRFLSRHAVGLAIDVFEVGFDDREILRVKAHWSAADHRLAKVAAVFEHAAAFRTPLTPANDPRDHDDHLHLEAHMQLGDRDAALVPKDEP